ncbi:MAG: hypothetical protein QOJ90_650, partial [Actinomycetota bacterium]|nr:hypothetical protein [Actinomycetota bacterium]
MGRAPDRVCTSRREAARSGLIWDPGQPRSDALVTPEGAANSVPTIGRLVMFHPGVTRIVTT